MKRIPLPALTFVDVDPQGADALALLHEATVDARALYPELFRGASVPATNGPLDERAVYIVAYDAGRPVACGALRLFDGATAELRRMYVARDERRKGFGGAVLNHLLREAIRLGYRRLLLETGHKQAPAMRLYEAHGFQHIPPFGPHADDPTSVCYERTLFTDGQAPPAAVPLSDLADPTAARVVPATPSDASS